MPQYNDHIETLIVRSFDNSLTPEDQAHLQAWLHKDIANQQYYNIIKKTWAIAGQADNDFVPDTTRNWERFRQQIMPAKVSFIHKYRNAIRIAATLIVIAAAATIWHTFFYHPMIDVATTAHEKKNIILPDGSQVSLNQNSHIRYAGNFNGNERSILLEGEAFFEVSQQADKPFIVNAGNTRTQVLGTSFHIRDDKAGNVSVSVVTGKVAFSATGNKKKLVLTQGNQGIATPDKHVQESKITDPNFMAWKENKLIFRDTPLSQVIKNLEEYFNIDIEVMDDTLLSYTYTGTFDQPKLEEVLEVVSESTALNWKKIQDKYVLSKQIQ